MEDTDTFVTFVASCCASGQRALLRLSALTSHGK
jgi:hypothetical protein